MGASDSSKEEDARRLRAVERATRITLRRTTLSAQDAEPPLTGRFAIELAAELSLAAWTISGRSLPRYTRATMPYVFVRSPKSS
jgi:hypothetical protein